MCKDSWKDQQLIIVRNVAEILDILEEQQGSGDHVDDCEGRK
jgi:hypothetical protein